MKHKANSPMITKSTTFSCVISVSCYSTCQLHVYSKMTCEFTKFTFDLSFVSKWPDYLGQNTLLPWASAFINKWKEKNQDSRTRGAHSGSRISHTPIGRNSWTDLSRVTQPFKIYALLTWCQKQIHGVL